MYHPYKVINLNAATTNFTTTYLQIITAANNTKQCNQLLFVGNATANLIFAFGDPGVEVPFAYLSVGSNTYAPLRILVPARQAISIKTLTGTISSGNFGVTLFT